MNIKVQYIATNGWKQKEFKKRQNAIEHITTVLKQLCTQYTMVEIQFTEKRLLLCGNQNERVLLDYFESLKANEHSVSGHLLDSSMNSDLERFELGNGEIDWIPSDETVSKEKAIEVTLFYMKNETFPEGLEWDGNMEKFR